MSTPSRFSLNQDVIAFDRFWTWLVRHPNCVLRAGTPDSVLYDQEEFHWHFDRDEDGSFVVEVQRGKQLVGELVIAPNEVIFVQVDAQTENEVVFECVVGTEAEPIAAYFFVLSHGFDPGEQPKKPGRWVH